MRVLIKRILWLVAMLCLGCGVKSAPTPYVELPDHQAEKPSTPNPSSTSENK